MGNLNAPIWGWDHHTRLNLDYIGKLKTGPQMLLTTRELFVAGKRVIKLNFTFECVYLNYAILYACQNPVFDANNKLVDADITQVTRWGTDEDSDMYPREIPINEQEWTVANGGGTKIRTADDRLVNGRISYLFTAWHRTNVLSTEYLQDKVRESQKDLLVTVSSSNAEFDFEDLTGVGEVSDDDFNDITMSFIVL